MSQYQWDGTSEVRVGEPTRIGPFAMFGALIVTGALFAGIAAVPLASAALPPLTRDITESVAVISPDLVGSLLLVAVAMLALSWKLRTDLEGKDLGGGSRDELAQHLEAMTASMLALALLGNALAGVATVGALFAGHGVRPAVEAIGTAIAMTLVLSFGARLPLHLEWERQRVRDGKELERLHRVLDGWAPESSRCRLFPLFLAPVAVLSIHTAVSFSSGHVDLTLSALVFGLTFVLVLLVTSLGAVFDHAQVVDRVSAWILGPLVVLIGLCGMASGLLWVCWPSSWVTVEIGIVQCIGGLLLVLAPFNLPHWRWNPRLVLRSWARRSALRQVRRIALRQS